MLQCHCSAQRSVAPLRGVERVAFPVQQVGPSAPPPGTSAAAQSAAVLLEGPAGAHAGNSQAPLSQPITQMLQTTPSLQASLAEKETDAWQSTFPAAEDTACAVHQAPMVQGQAHLAQSLGSQQQPFSPWADFTALEGTAPEADQEGVLEDSFAAEQPAAGGSGSSAQRDAGVEPTQERDAAKIGAVPDLAFPLLLPKREPPLPPPLAAAAFPQKQSSLVKDAEAVSVGAGPAADKAVISSHPADSSVTQPQNNESNSGLCGASSVPLDRRADESDVLSWQPMSAVDKEKCRRAFREKASIIAAMYFLQSRHFFVSPACLQLICVHVRCSTSLCISVASDNPSCSGFLPLLQGFAQLGGVSPEDAQLLHKAAGVKTDFQSLWSLSDMDADGKLSETEFVLLMHLLKAERKGARLPKQLPLPQV